MQPLWKKCDVVTVISGGTAPLDLALHPSRFGSTASASATELQLTVANRNYLHQLAPTCTNLRNLHQKIFCQKNKSEEGLSASRALNVNVTDVRRHSTRALLSQADLGNGFVPVRHLNRIVPESDKPSFSFRL